MERNFNNVDFERFLKENANQYRMYPSEKSWKGIYHAIHGRRRWFGLGFVFLLLGGGLTTLFVVNSKKTNLREMAVNPTVQTSAEPAQGGQSSGTARIIPFNRTDIIPGSNTEPQTGVVSTELQADHNFPVASLVNQSPASNERTSLAIINQPAAVDPLTDQATDQQEYVSGFNLVQNAQKQEKTEKSSVYMLPLTIESVTNAYKPFRRKKVTAQLYFAPTISYRKLSENKAFLQNAPLAPNVPYNYAPLYNINDVVTHKPDLGVEFGIAAKYPVSKSINVRAGVQFNVSRYEIKAFNYPLEFTTIALNDGADSLTAFSSYRNFNGGRPNWLKNFYFQVSLPVGVEVKLAGDDKVQFGVASTVQPTYVLGDRAYLISSDYKNYAEVPWLIRRWNINTNLETYVSYSTGRLKWQVGPQVRYQLLSSFISDYPVKENLFDFGLKVGVGLNK